MDNDESEWIEIKTNSTLKETKIASKEKFPDASYGFMQLWDTDKIRELNTFNIVREPVIGGPRKARTGVEMAEAMNETNNPSKFGLEGRHAFAKPNGAFH